MGLLDQVIGSVLGNVLGGGQPAPQGQGRAPQGPGGGLGDMLGSAVSSPLVKALLMLLAAKAASGGGLGDIFGGGASRGGGSPRPEADAGPGGFPQGNPFERDPSTREGAGPVADADNPYGDLAGAFDKPGASGRTGMGAASGGLDGLADSFQRGGFGDVLESWIGAGENRPIAPHQLSDALGPDTVSQLSQQTGMSRDDLLAQLAQVLPGVVDKLTPGGRRPTQDETRHW